MARSIAICFASFALLLASPGRADSREQVARGLRVLQMQGCVSCHSLDGSPSAGPSFAGRYGSSVQIRVAGSTLDVSFDRGYLERSLSQPDTELAVGFAPGVMPAFALTEEQMDGVEAALQSLKGPVPEPASPIHQGLVVGGTILFFALLIAWGTRLGRNRKS